MSAHWIIRFRGQPVRFGALAGKQLYSIVPATMATPFISEADAWAAAMGHGLDPEFIEMENRNAGVQASACSPTDTLKRELQPDTLKRELQPDTLKRELQPEIP